MLTVSSVPEIEPVLFSAEVLLPKVSVVPAAIVMVPALVVAPEPPPKSRIDPAPEIEISPAAALVRPTLGSI